MLYRLPAEEVFAATHLIWDKKEIADKIARETIEIIKSACHKKFIFFSGRREKWIIAGLFYLLGYRYNSPKKQIEIADLLGTSDFTVRDSYRRWLLAFPDFFEDVVKTFSADEKLKFFITDNLKKQVVK
jgi:transcription initiation factor TFIIIB Brf1 subunit/transcription initiation factor TFIIB